jgi:hypothetical protein
VLSRYAAPPAKKHAAQWILLAFTAAGLAVGSYATGRSGAVIVGLVAVVSAAFAVRAARYNARVYPDLQKLWAHSFMCSRCGEIFSWSFRAEPRSGGVEESRASR